MKPMSGDEGLTVGIFIGLGYGFIIGVTFSYVFL